MNPPGDQDGCAPSAMPSGIDSQVFGAAGSTRHDVSLEALRRGREREDMARLDPTAFDWLIAMVDALDPPGCLADDGPDVPAALDEAMHKALDALAPRPAA